MKVGFVGLGAMGLPMARNLVAAGHAVTGYDIRRDAVDAFAASGGRAARCPAEAASGSEVLVLMVVDADQAEAALFGDEPAAPELADGAVVVASCTQPATRARALATRLGSMGLFLLDAPVSGGVVGAEQGALSIMASGADEAFERAGPVLDVLGKFVWRMGAEPGLGSMMKTVNQLMCGAHIAIAAEAMSLAARAGLDAKLAQEVLMAGAAASWMLGNRGPRMLQSDPPVASAVDIFVKDLDIVLDAGRDLKAALPLAAAAHQMFLGASGLGHGKQDDSQVLKAYESLSGIDVPRG